MDVAKNVIFILFWVSRRLDVSKEFHSFCNISTYIYVDKSRRVIPKRWYVLVQTHLDQNQHCHPNLSRSCPPVFLYQVWDTYSRNWNTGMAAI